MYLHKARGTLWMQAWGLRPFFWKNLLIIYRKQAISWFWGLVI